MSDATREEMREALAREGARLLGSLDHVWGPRPPPLGFAAFRRTKPRSPTGVLHDRALYVTAAGDAFLVVQGPEIELTTVFADGRVVSTRGHVSSADALHPLLVAHAHRVDKRVGGASRASALRRHDDVGTYRDVYAELEPVFAREAKPWAAVFGVVFLAAFVAGGWALHGSATKAPGFDDWLAGLELLFAGAFVPAVLLVIALRSVVAWARRDAYRIAPLSDVAAGPYRTAHRVRVRVDEEAAPRSPVVSAAVEVEEDAVEEEEPRRAAMRR